MVQTILDIVHAAVALAWGLGIVALYRWVMRQSRVVGIILGAMILIRLFLGLALFTVYSFSPVLVADSTQALKDEVFNATIIGSCLAVLALRRLTQPGLKDRRYGPLALALAGMMLAIYAGAGIRWYYSFLMWC